MNLALAHRNPRIAAADKAAMDREKDRQVAPVAAPLLAAAAEPRREWMFTVPGVPVPKPRMTRADVWKKRPCVLRYREFCDRVRAAAPADLPQAPRSLRIVVFLPIAPSLSARLRAQLHGTEHRQKPDCDNLIKGVCDALFPKDECVCRIEAEKYWEHAAVGPCTNVFVAL